MGTEETERLKRLQHRLRSSHRLLRESRQRGCVHRRSPWCNHRFRGSKPRLFLTESVELFGFGGSASCLAKRVTRPTSDRSTVF